MKYEFIASHQKEYGVGLACRTLGVSVSGYYAWRKRQPSRRAVANEVIEAQLVRLYEQSHGTYGSPRLTAALRQMGVVCNRKRGIRLMRRAGIAARRRTRRVRTTVSDASLPVAPNHLNREFHADAVVSRRVCK